MTEDDDFVPEGLWTNAISPRKISQQLKEYKNHLILEEARYGDEEVKYMVIRHDLGPVPKIIGRHMTASEADAIAKVLRAVDE